jgi:hypothetical protein
MMERANCAKGIFTRPDRSDVFVQTDGVRCILSLCVCILLTLPGMAHAQLGEQPGDGMGETYRVEASAGLWNVSPHIVISADAFGIQGSSLDFVRDAGVVDKRLLQLRLVLRPGPHHKIRISYVPTSFDAQTTLKRTIVFRGVDYNFGIPISTSVTWHTLRVGYEYDFLSSTRGFLGAIGEVRYARVGADVSSSIIGLETSIADAWIPAIGLGGRLYVAPRLSLNGEVTWFKIPGILDEITRNAGGRSTDFDLSGMVSLTSKVGVRAGYRTLDVAYRLNNNAASLGLRGVYVSTVLRF